MVSENQNLFSYVTSYQVVLILVVVEDGLRGIEAVIGDRVFCLNPCCGGRWSQSPSWQITRKEN